ncbi:unnamed protein product [Schistocephalus solidus]|uniref:Trafficking protein particle complex subunit 9 n=1 Tax=Schistocephalus solidus TaxID=70667 RepID=A0A183SC68_SCHSO|nr:unnamed protein product [Schistocephalus solidus]
MGSEPGVVARPGAVPAAPATCALSHLRFLDSVLTPGSGGGAGESSVAAAQSFYHLKLIHAQVTVPAPPGVEHIYYHLKLIHAQVTVPAPPGVEHTVHLVEIDDRTAV